MKTLLKSLSFRVWLIVTAVIAAIAIVVNVLLTTTFYPLACFLFG